MFACSPNEPLTRGLVSKAEIDAPAEVYPCYCGMCGRVWRRGRARRVTVCGVLRAYKVIRIRFADSSNSNVQTYDWTARPANALGIVLAHHMQL